MLRSPCVSYLNTKMEMQPSGTPIQSSFLLRLIQIPQRFFQFHLRGHKLVFQAVSLLLQAVILLLQLPHSLLK